MGALTACSASSDREALGGSTGHGTDSTASESDDAHSRGGSGSGGDAADEGDTSGPSSDTTKGGDTTGDAPDVDTNANLPDNPNDGPIYALGDSVMEFYEDEGASIPQVAGAVVGREVVNVSRGGAMVLEGEDPIPTQYAQGDWSWVIVEGGANDLGDGCGCGQCLDVVDALINDDSDEGVMVDLLDQIRTEGHFILLAGYYRIPDTAEEFVECEEEFAALSTRYRAYANRHDTVVFVDMGEAMDGTDLTLYAEDRVHPSLEGSAAVGALIGEVLRGE